MGAAPSTLIGDVNMFGNPHTYVSMKKDDIAALLSRHIMSGDIYYAATSSDHRYDVCISFYDGIVERSMVINIADHYGDSNHPETRAAGLLRSALPESHPGRYALLEAPVKGILVLVDVHKVQKYAPVVEWGPGGVTCTLTLEYNWSRAKSAHKIVIDAWDESTIIDLMNRYNSALKHKYEAVVVGWNPIA